MLLPTLSQLHHATAHIIYVCPGFHQCNDLSCPRTLPRKIQWNRFGLNPGLPGHQSYTLSMRHTGSPRIGRRSMDLCWVEIPPCVINPFPNKPWFLPVCSTSLLKILWEKEKLLVVNNFSFSRSVFYPFGKLSAISNKFNIVTWILFQFRMV